MRDSLCILLSQIANLKIIRNIDILLLFICLGFVEAATCFLGLTCPILLGGLGGLCGFGGGFRDGVRLSGGVEWGWLDSVLSNLLHTQAKNQRIHPHLHTSLTSYKSTLLFDFIFRHIAALI